MMAGNPFHLGTIEREIAETLGRGETFEGKAGRVAPSDIIELITAPRGYSQSTEGALAAAGYNPADLNVISGSYAGPDSIEELLGMGLGEASGITGALEDALQYQRRRAPDERTRNAAATVRERLAKGEPALEGDTRPVYGGRRRDGEEDDPLAPFLTPDEGSRQVGPDTVTSSGGASASRDLAPGSALPDSAPATQQGTGESPERGEDREGFWSRAKSIVTGEELFSNIYDFIDRSLVARDERAAERDLRDAYEGDIPEAGVSTAGVSPVLGGALDRQSVARAEAAEQEARSTLSELLEDAITDDDGNRTDLDPNTLPTLLNFVDRTQRAADGGTPFLPEGEELQRFAESMDFTQSQVDSLLNTQELTRELGLDEEREPGALVQFLEEAGRGLYGLAGAASGYTDQIERTEEEEDMSVLELAGSRALEGFKNERQYTSRDVTGVTDTSDMHWLARSGWALSHFAMDVGADPVSYVTLGGAGMSRRTISEAVERSVLRSAEKVGRSELSTLGREGQERLLRNVGDDVVFNERVATAVRDDIVGPVGSGARRPSQMDASGRRAAAGEQSGVDAGAVDDVLTDMNLTRLDVLEAIEELGGSPELRRQMLQDGLRNVSAGAFQKGGATGMRRQLRAVFGDESVYRAMDDSLQGGFQLTVPFVSRKADFGRRAVTYKPRSEAMGRAAQAAATFYNKRRTATAAARPGQAFQHVFGGKNRHEVKQLSQLLRYGDDETVGAAWAQYAAMRDAKLISAEAARAAGTRSRGVFYTTSNHLLGANDPEAATEAMRTVWASKSGLVDEATGMDDLGRKVVKGLDELDPVDVQAGRAAFEELDGLVRQVGRDAQELTGDSGEAMRLLNNYAPRRIREITEELSAAPGSAGVRARADHARARSGFGAVFDIDETSGDWVVRSWQSAPEVLEDAATGGRQVMFDDDPTEAIVGYLESMDRYLAEQHVLRHLRSKGFETQPAGLARWVEGSADSSRVQDVLEPSTQAMRAGEERTQAARSARALGREDQADELLGDLPDVIGQKRADEILQGTEGFRIDYRPGRQAARGATDDVVAAADAGPAARQADEAVPEEAAGRFWHGTTADLEVGDVIEPASEAGGQVIHPNKTNPNVAYASSDPANAEHYSELAWNATDEGEQWVYEVRPLGEVEPDPNIQNADARAFEGDVVSGDGFEVVRKLTPEEARAESIRARQPRKAAEPEEARKAAISAKSDRFMADQNRRPRSNDIVRELEAEELPRDLAGAKPKWKTYGVDFSSDVDRALFITSQTKKSKRDGDYRAWLLGLGFEDADIDAAGRELRQALKDAEARAVKAGRGTDATLRPAFQGARRIADRRAAIDIPMPGEAPAPARSVVDVAEGASPAPAAAAAEEAAEEVPGKWTVTRGGVTREFDDWTDAVAWGEREVASDLWDSTADAVLGQIRHDRSMVNQLADARVLHSMPDEEMVEYIDEVTQIVARYVDPDASHAGVKGKVFGKDPLASRYAKKLADQGWDREDAFRTQRQLIEQGKDPEALDKQALQAALDEGLLRPSAHAESLARIGATQTTSSEEYARLFVDKIWQPYYTTFKTLATVGRGPGFAIRNALGGAHNAYISGARVSHFRNAEKMMKLEHSAKRRVLKRLRDTDEVVSWFDVEQMIKDEVRTSFRKSFGTKKQPDRGDRFFDALEQFYNRNLMSGSRTDELTQQTMLGGQASQQSASRYAGGPGAAGMSEIDLSGPRWARVLENRGFGRRPTKAAQVGEMDPALARGAGVSNTVFLGKQRDELGKMGHAVQALADNPWVRANASLAEVSEKYTRLPPFLAGLDRFGIEDGGRAASLLVKASQFDYSDLTDWERRGLRNLMPFYTFSRFNIPFQVRGLVMEPHAYAKLGHGWEATQDAVGIDDRWKEEVFPRWVRDNMGKALDFAPADIPGADMLSRIPVLGGMFQSQHPIALNLSSLPAMDLNKLFEAGGTFGVFSESARDELISMTNPLIKTPLEGFLDVNTFTRGRLPESERAWGVLQNDVGAALPFFERDGSGEVSAPGWLTRVPRQLVPPVGQAERLLGSNDRYQDRMLTSWLSNMAGGPVSTLDAPQLYANARREQERLLDDITGWRGRGVDNDDLRMLVDSGVPLEAVEEAHSRGQLPELVDLIAGMVED